MEVIKLQIRTHFIKNISYIAHWGMASRFRPSVNFYLPPHCFQNIFN